MFLGDGEKVGEGSDIDGCVEAVSSYGWDETMRAGCLPVSPPRLRAKKQIIKPSAPEVDVVDKLADLRGERLVAVAEEAVVVPQHVLERVDIVGEDVFILALGVDPFKKSRVVSA